MAIHKYFHARLLRFLLGIASLMLGGLSGQEMRGVSSSQDKRPQPTSQHAVALPVAIGDPVQQFFSADIDKLRSQLTNAKLNNVTREQLELALANDEKRLEDHKENVLLWSNLRRNEVAQDREGTQEAETKLAAYLTRKIETIEGKSYPTNMSLAKVMDIYNAHLGIRSYSGSGKALIRFVLLCILLLAPLAMIFLAIRKKLTSL